MSDRVPMKTESESSISSTFGASRQHTNARVRTRVHTHTHTQTHACSPISHLFVSSLRTIPQNVLKPSNNGNGLVRRVAEAATMRDLAKLPPRLVRGRCSSCSVRKDP